MSGSYPPTIVIFIMQQQQQEKKKDRGKKENLICLACARCSVDLARSPRGCLPARPFVCVKNQDKCGFVCARKKG